MPQEITTIHLGGINCYLIKTGDSFVLIDTGMQKNRDRLEQKLQLAGCKPRDIALVILTHGDHDHSGNCKYLKEQYGLRIAMHRADSGMVEYGDMTWNRKAKPDRHAFLFRVLSLFAGETAFSPFTPDMYLEEGDRLSDYGLDARIVHLPGHSRGSIGVLTDEGDLFCGDLMVNIIKPRLHFVINDLAAARASVEKIKGMEIKAVYPGHGKPFGMDDF